MSTRVPPRHERGIALIIAILFLLLLSATGLGLALTAALEPATTFNFEVRAAGLNAAESGVVLAAHDLASCANWSTALRGTWTPPHLAAASGSATVTTAIETVTLDQFTNRINCHHAAACSPEDLAEVSADRPWGTNNPRYVLLGSLDMADTWSIGPRGAFFVVIWVADDDAEVDGDPLTDGDPAPDDLSTVSPGRGRLILRAEAFGPRGAHAAVTATVERHGPGVPLRLREWRLG
jgi:hypothetical protein